MTTEFVQKLIDALFGFVMWIFSGLLEKIDIRETKICKNVSKALKGLSVLYTLLNIVFDDFVFSVLHYLQDHLWMIHIYVLLVAILSPVVAWYQNQRRNYQAEDSYFKGNALFNILGSLAPWGMLSIAENIIANFEVLKDFKIQSVISVFIPACVAFALLYQSEEQKNAAVKDHDCSLKWLNQQINMLHLFNVFFLSIVSSIYIVTYTMYCRIHNKQLVMRLNYFVFLVIILLFFYILSFKEYDYLFMIFVIDVPAILISSIYWMTWFTMSETMLGVELVFIIINLFAYTLRILAREKIIIIGEKPENSDEYKLHHEKSGKGIYIKSGFYIISTLFAITAYALIWLIPMAIERIPSDEARNYINKICENTEYEAEDILQRAREEDIYDPVEDDYDKSGYLHFIFRELREPMESKQIIEPGDENIQYDTLCKWYLRAS